MPEHKNLQLHEKIVSHTAYYFVLYWSIFF